MLILTLLGNTQMKEATSLQRSDVDSKRGVLINGNSKLAHRHLTLILLGPPWLGGWVARDRHRRGRDV